MRCEWYVRCEYFDFGLSVDNKLFMKVLTQQQIKQQQLKLLQTSGFSLGECTKTQNTSKILKELTNFIKITEIQRLKVSRVRNMGLSSNANLRSFSLILLTSIYSSHLKQDLLDIVKSMLYHPELDLTKIKHTPLPNVSSKQMKKIIVQFFYSLVYSSYEDKIQGKLCKYPIVMDILVIFLRCLLTQLKVKHADNYLLKLPTRTTIQALINFFDLSCRTTSTMFLLHQDKLFIYENQNEQTIVGSYSQNDGQRNRPLDLSELSQQMEEDTDNEGSRRQSITSHNRSLQFKGIVSESVVFDHQAPTPFFNLENPNSSFQSSPEGDTNHRQNLVFLRQSKEMKNLKAMDLSMHQSQTNVGFGNMKRTMLQNQLKESLESKQKLAMDSPITLDSPHNLFLQGNFGRIGEANQRQQDMRMMKKSKSESARPQSSHKPNQEDQSRSNMKKKEQVEMGKATKKRNYNCQCIKIKRQSIKLNSNVYEVNMRYVANSNNKTQDSSYSNVSKGQIYVNSKGLNCELYAPPKTNNTTSIQCIRQNYLQQKKNELNGSINSHKVVPQSETLSKRSFSPLSNTGQRSFSPYGGSSCNTSPKIVFTYKNPLKYSIQLNTKNSKKC